MTTMLRRLAPAFALATVAAPLAAQSGNGDNLKLAFGYLCEDRFTVRNESDVPMDVTYDVEGGPESGRLHLDPGQGTEIVPSTVGDVRLLVDGQVVATARNEQRACAARRVVVRPIYADAAVTVVDPYYAYPPVVPVYWVPRRWVVAPSVGVYAGVRFGGPYVRGGVVIGTPPVIVNRPIYRRPVIYREPVVYGGWRHEDRGWHRGWDRGDRDDRDWDRGERGDRGDRGDRGHGNGKGWGHRR